MSFSNNSLDYLNTLLCVILFLVLSKFVRNQSKSKCNLRLLLGMKILHQFIPFVNNLHQFFQKHFLSALVSFCLLPLWKDKEKIHQLYLQKTCISWYVQSYDIGYLMMYAILWYTKSTFVNTDLFSTFLYKAYFIKAWIHTKCS